MKLNYKIIGSGEPVIILHGLFGMLDNWLTIAKNIQDQYQCILVDLRNHGKSPHDDEMNYQIMAEDVEELMHDLNIKEAALIGHSMGGKVAMQLALSFPEAVTKLIVVDISPRQYPRHHDDVIKAIQSIDPGKIKHRSDAETSFRKHLGNDDATVQFLLKNLGRHIEGGFEWKANMPALIANYDILMQSIQSDSTFDKRTLFIRGETSNSIREEDWDQTRSFFPNAVLITIPGAGHWVHADAPKAITEAILTFLSA